MSHFLQSLLETIKIISVVICILMLRKRTQLSTSWCDKQKKKWEKKLKFIYLLFIGRRVGGREKKRVHSCYRSKKLSRNLGESQKKTFCGFLIENLSAFHSHSALAITHFHLLSVLFFSGLHDSFFCVNSFTVTFSAVTYLHVNDFSLSLTRSSLRPFKRLHSKSREVLKKKIE